MADQSEKHRWWQILVGLLAAIGVPMTAGLTFAEIVQRRPLLAGALLLTYEITLLVCAFLAKVWARLEDIWVKKTADAAINAIEQWISAYQRRYYKLLVYRHRALDMKGHSTQGTFSLRLAAVFVDLSIVPQPAHKISPHLLGAQERVIRGKRYNIIDFLTSDELRFASTAIIGPPGSGKSTLLKHLTLQLAQGDVEKRFTRIPFLIVLRDHSERIKNAIHIPLVEIIEESLTSIGIPAPAGWVQQKLRKGHCAVMMDGLDEIANPATRRLVATWIDEQLNKYAPNRFLITSRPYGYQSNPLTNITVFEVRPFTPRQVRQFVHNWYWANELISAEEDNPAVKIAATQGAEDLLGRLRKSPDLLELSVNPLLLTMIVTVHRYRSSLPGRRVELYSEILEVFLGKRQQAKGLELELTAAQKRRVLEPLAHAMMLQNTREIGSQQAVKKTREALALVAPSFDPETFLKDIQDACGILVERENLVYSFAHLTFQEYLAASHIRNRHLEEEALQQVNDSWWHETLRLYSAQGDASPVIAACLSASQPSLQALTLASECLDEALEVRPELRHQVESLLNNSHSSDHRRLHARRRLKLRVRKLLRREEGTIFDDSLVSSAEYQLFVEDTGPSHKLSHTDTILPSDHISMRAATGIQASDAKAFCTWLTEQEGNGWVFRLPSEDEAFANPLELTSRDAPLFYWVSAAGQERTAPATTLSDEGYFVDPLEAIFGDLSDIAGTDIDIGLANHIERTSEVWGELPQDVRLEQVIGKLEMGPAINTDLIIHLSRAADLDRLFERYDERYIHLARIVLSAASIEFTGNTDAVAVKTLESAISSLTDLLQLGSSDREDALALDLAGTIGEMSSIASVQTAEEVDDSSTHRKRSKEQKKLRVTIRGSNGAILQSSSHRQMVAQRLGALFPTEKYSHPRRTAMSRKPAEGFRRRAVIRLLALVLAWKLLRKEQRLQEDAMRKSGKRETIRLEAILVLMQAFVFLSIWEERLAGILPSVETIRLAREAPTENLAITFDQEERARTVYWTNVEESGAAPIPAKANVSGKQTTADPRS